MPKPLSQKAINNIIALTREGLPMKRISEQLGIPYQTICKYVRLFKVREEMPKDMVALPSDAPSSDITAEFKTANANLKSEVSQPIQPPPAPAITKNAPANLTEMESRLETLAGNLVVGAENLLQSILVETPEQLAFNTLKDRTNALGTIIDKLAVITNKNKSILGLTANGPVSIVNIIAGASVPRKKDAAPRIEAEDAEVVPSEEDLLA